MRRAHLLSIDPFSAEIEDNCSDLCRRRPRDNLQNFAMHLTAQGSRNANFKDNVKTEWKFWRRLAHHFLVFVTIMLTYI